MSRWYLPPTDLGGRLSASLGRRSAAGPHPDDALTRAADLQAEARARLGPGSTATPRVTCEYVAHRARSSAEADAAASLLVDMLRSAGASGLSTGAALDLLVPLPVLGAGRLAEDRVRALADAAAAAGTWLTLRPLEHTDVDTVHGLVSRLRPDVEDLGVELWAGLRRSTGDVRVLLPDRSAASRAATPRRPPRVLLRADPDRRRVPPSVGLPTPTDADRAYVRLAKRLLREPARATLAPGDPTLLGIVQSLADATPARDDGSWWEVMVELGRRVEDVHRLLAAGRPVRVSVPFGPRWRAVGLRRSMAVASGRRP